MILEVSRLLQAVTAAVSAQGSAKMAACDKLHQVDLQHLLR